MQNVRVIGVDEETAERYGELFARLHAKGTPIPTNDIWIAATAIQHGLDLFTYDRHFRNVDGLTVGEAPADFGD